MKVLDNAVKDRLVVVDQVHLVHREDKVADLEQIGDEGVALGLLDHSLAGIDKNDRQISGRGPRHHIAGVLDVPWSIGDDKLTPRRGKIAVGDIDGDALFPLGSKAIGEEGKVDYSIPSTAGAFLHGAELVLKDTLRVIEKTPD